MRYVLVLVLFLLSVAPAMAKERSSFILVHGAFVGAWYWEPVAEGLRGLGHEVRAVDLTGHGDRAAEISAEVTLADHIADVLAAIEAAPGPVILVAHSYGGRPATGAWDRARDRVAAVIYLEAMAPYGSGDLALPEDRVQRLAMAEADPAALARGLLYPPAPLVRRYRGRQIVPQSLAALYGAVRLTRGPLPDTPGAYVVGTTSEAAIYREYARRVQNERGWTVWEIESGHDMVHDAAEVLVRLLDLLAQTLPK